jgi:photosystem II stability/assembly factor-like uncharacterized protein
VKRALEFLSLVLSILTPIDPVHAQWIRTNGNFVGDVRDFAVSDTILFAGTWDDGVIRTTDNGTNWTLVNAGITDINVLSLAVDPNGLGGMNIFAGTLFGGVFLSTNNGTNWTPVNNGLSGNGVDALAVSSNEDGSANIFAAVGGGGVFLSTNHGTSWTAVNNGFTPPDVIYGINGLTIYGNTVYAATGFGVFVSTNNGTNWSPINNGLTNINIRTIAVSCSGGDTILFAGTFNGGVFRSTNSGRSWASSNTGLASTVIYSFAVVDDRKGRTNIFVGISGGGGVYLSANFGTSWASVDSGLATKFPPSVFALTVCGTNLFAGTDDGVWRRPIAEMITSVPVPCGNIPSEFVLEQNYPNPFNPSTKIQYELQKESEVKLFIYNVLGEKVAELVNTIQKAGKYEVEWNARKFASGVYIYQIKAGEFISSKKILLLR